MSNFLKPFFLLECSFLRGKRCGVCSNSSNFVFAVNTSYTLLYEKSLLNIPNKCVCSFFQIFVDWGWHLTHWGRKAAEFLYFYYSILALAPRDWMRGLARIWSLWHLLVIVGWQVELQTNHLWSFHNHGEGPYRAFSWLKVPNIALTCKALFLF